MKKNHTVLRHATAAGAALLLALPLIAHAHRPFILPSTSLVDNPGAVVTIDASASEQLFNIDHALPLDTISVTGPDGVQVTPEDAHTGRQRSSFELRLPKAGTYRVSLTGDTLFAMYKVDGQMKRWRGSADDLAKAVPADAQDLNVMRMESREDTFVTAGDPGTSPPHWTPSGKGLEMVPLSAPTGLLVGDTSSLRFLLDGKPAAGLLVTVIRGGARYRDALGEITLKTDDDGKVSVQWPGAGMYWVGAAVGGRKPGMTGTAAQPIRRVSYSATFEVLQP